MSTLTITIELDNAAFTNVTNDDDNGTPNVGPEVADLLHRLANQVGDHAYPTSLHGYVLNDSNGHGVLLTTVTD